MKVLLVLAVVAFGRAAAASESINAALTDTVLKGYNSLSPPDGTMEVSFGFTALDIGLCPHEQVLDMKGWMQMTWKDERLSWDANKWGIDSLRIPKDQVWVPDITVYNSITKMDYFHPDGISRAVVRSTGDVVLVPAIGIKSVCEVDPETYPFGTQNCTLKIGSWTADASRIKLAQMDDVFNYENVPKSKVEIVDSSVKEVMKTYDCCPNEKYQSLEFNIVFKMKAVYRQGRYITANNP